MTVTAPVVLPEADVERFLDYDIEPRCEWLAEEPPHLQCLDTAEYRITWDGACEHVTLTNLVCTEHAQSCHVGEGFTCVVCNDVTTIVSITKL